MSQQLDEIDLALLNRIQEGVPLIARPFRALADDLGLAEREVQKRLLRLKQEIHLIRQISAIFDSRALGYASTLVASRVDPARVDDAAAVISGHPGVSHNYRRNHEFNLWYTLTIPPDSRLGLERTVQILHERSGAFSTRLMPALRMFKIGVKFDMTGETGSAAAPAPQAPEINPASLPPLGDVHKSAIRILQQDLPIIFEPFAEWASQAGLASDELLAIANWLKSRGFMRRFSAVLHHRRAGFSANAMGVWIVPAEQREAFGRTAASFSAVTHCYERPTWPDWPYSLYTMVHAQSSEACEKILARIAAATGIPDYAALYSAIEYKKIRVKYFDQDLKQWEGASTAAGQLS